MHGIFWRKIGFSNWFLVSFCSKNWRPAAEKFLKDQVFVIISDAADSENKSHSLEAVTCPVWNIQSCVANRCTLVEAL